MLLKIRLGIAYVNVYRITDIGELMQNLIKNHIGSDFQQMLHDIEILTPNKEISSFKRIPHLLLVPK